MDLAAMAPMRKGLAIAGVVVVAGLVALVVVSSWPDPRRLPSSRVELHRSGPTEVTIVWRTRSAALGEIFYQPVGTAGEPLSVREPPPPAERHEVVIAGLEPGKRYQYWLAGSDARYHFETQPLPTVPFSALLVWGEPADRIAQLAQSETPGFILSLTPLSAAKPDPYREVTPNVVLYGPTGVSSQVIEQAPQSPAWSLDWGGLRLLLLADEGAAIGALLDTPAPHTFGVILPQGGPIAPAKSKLHQALKAHNAKVPSQPVAFVIQRGAAGGEPLQADGVTYLGLPLEAAGALRLDVGPESTVASFLDAAKREVALRAPKLERRRTCKECRQLADRGAYEESVKAYQEFIKNNEGHFQIDDAHYAIAEILDERLFRYTEALVYYRKLVADYPKSTLVPLSQQRIKHLTAHSDYDFVPLERFERIRKVELARHKKNPAGRAQALADVRQIISDFPKSSLAPEMSYWLANQLRADEPDQAVATYRELLRSYPDYPGTADARIEIGETYYQAGRYGEAIAALTEARAAVPARAAAIDTQIRRSERNQRRISLAWTGWLGLLLIAVPGATIWRSRERFSRELKRAAIALLILAALLLVGGWLIHEQFSSRAELLGLALGLAAAACLGFPLGAGPARKLAGARRPLLAALGGAVLGLIWLAAGGYLTVYYCNEHYLTGFGM